MQTSCCCCCRWAYDDTKACLVLDSDRNTLLKAEKRRSAQDAHQLEARSQRGAGLHQCICMIAYRIVPRR